MGTFSGVLKEAGEVIAHEGGPLLRSDLAILSKTDVGKKFATYVTHVFEPEVKKTAQSFVSAGTHTAPDALKESTELLRKAHFGPQGQGLTHVVEDAHAKKGIRHAQDVADAISTYFHDSGMTNSEFRSAAVKAGTPITKHSGLDPQGRAEKIIKRVVSAETAGRIMIPHLTQPINSLMVTGYKAGFKAIFDVATDYAGAKTLRNKSGALIDELVRESAQPTWLRNLIQPGFGAARKLQLTFTAVAGKHAALDAAERLAKNNVDRYALRELTFLGIDPTKVLVQGGKLLPEDIERAAYRSASETMFIDRGFRTPHYWEKNAMARMATMFKHYPYNEGRFLVSAIRRSAEQGPATLVRTMATIGFLFPIAGELTRGLEHLVTQSPIYEEDNKNMRDRLVADYAMIGTFGILANSFRSAIRNNVAGFIGGPVVGVASDFAQDTAAIIKDHYDDAGDKSKQTHLRRFGRDLVKKTGAAGPILANLAFPKKEGTHMKRMKHAGLKSEDGKSETGNLEINYNSSLPSALGKGVDTNTIKRMAQEGRTMRNDEINRAQKIFGNTINYKQVRIYPEDVYVSAVTPDEAKNYIRLSEDKALIHELTHIWQLQTGLIKTADGDRTYNYGGIEGLKEAIKDNKKFTDFTVEQMAKIVEDFEKNPKSLVHAHFVKQLQNRKPSSLPDPQQVFLESVKMWQDSPNSKIKDTMYTKDY